MKKWTARVLILAILTVTLLGALPVYAANDDITTGNETITVSNSTSSGISIAGNTFNVYHLFYEDSETSFAVHEDFVGYFSGTKTNGYASTVNFDALKASSDNLYNYAAASFVNSYNDTNTMYILADEIRDYIITNETDPTQSSAVPTSEDGYEYTTFSGLDYGYYFVMSPESTIGGLGVAADGAFVILEEGSSPELAVKTHSPTVTKDIWHNDLSDWDVVGDYQIGDTAEFLVTSVLPADVSSYQTFDYYYVLTDTMSQGLTPTEDVTIYIDAELENQLNAQYVEYITYDGNTFTVKINVAALDEDLDLTHLYFYYTATVNEDAVVSTDRETNQVTLTFSNNPYDESDTGTSDATVYSYTFDMDVLKTDETGETPLAGAEFALSDEDGQIYLAFAETIDDVDYYYTLAEQSGEDAGTIITSATGKFNISGLDDATTYTLTEVAAPEGYNAINPITFTITAGYDALGTIDSLTIDNSSFSADTSGLSATIVNRQTILLPETGGIGTTIFQVIGALLIGTALVLLVLKTKKKSA